MSDLPIALDTSLKGRTVHDFYALKMSLPGATIRLLDGAGIVTFDPGDGSGSQKFLGRDAIYGVLESADAFKDGFGDNAPALSFSIAPATDGAVLALINQANQMAPVKVWYGTRDPASGAVIATSLRFDGFLDFATIEGEPGGGISIEFQCVTWAELYFRNREGISLSDAHHQSLYPGELGLAYVTGIQRTIVWGPGDRPSNVTYVGGGSGGVGGGGGGGRAFEGFNVNLV